LLPPLRFIETQYIGVGEGALYIMVIVVVVVIVEERLF